MPRYRALDAVPHFCTITLLDWIPVFIEARYMDPILASLKFCREKKGLRLFAFVVMPTHVHFIAGATEDLNSVVRDFKRFTSRRIHDLLTENGRVSLLEWFKSAKRRNPQGKEQFSLWKVGFHPQALYSEEVFTQKLEYLHNNPVRKGLVGRPEDWYFSSASNYQGHPDPCLEIDLIEDW